MSEFIFKPVEKQDIPRACELEIAGYPEDEAASLDALQLRQEQASALFLGVYLQDALLGFICATLTPTPTLTHESMSKHVPSAPYVAIHSVCVDREHRRKGVALKLLKEYTNRLQSDQDLTGARLITHENLIGLYQKAGFQMIGKSAVVHGSEAWYEMGVDFDSASDNASTIQEKEQNTVENATIRNPGKTWQSFGSVEKLLDKEGNTNAANLYCPRAQCKCLLLKAGAGTWVASRSSDLKLPPLPRHISAADESTITPGHWSVSSPLHFENIGFSRNAPPHLSKDGTTTAKMTDSRAAVIKYLICADCDQGPLGWHDTEGQNLGVEVEAENEGREATLRRGREFLLDVTRVRYELQ